MARQLYTLCGATLILASVYLIMVDQGIEGFPLERASIVNKTTRISRSAQKNGPVPRCSNQTYCVDTPYYPSDYVDLLLSTNDTLKYLATSDVPSGIAERMDEGDEEEQPLCKSTEDVVLPRTGLNIDGQWLYIINSETYVQRVRVEICTSANTECSFIEGFAHGYTTVCRQSYIYRQLVAIGRDGSAILELFKIPASCKCFFQFVADPWSRMDMSVGTGNKKSPVPKRNKQRRMW